MNQIPPGYRHALTQEEKEEYEHNLENQQFANGESDWLDLEAPEDRIPPQVLETQSPTQADLTPEEYRTIYGNDEELEALTPTTTTKEISEPKEIDVNRIMTKVVMRKILDKDLDVTLNPTEFTIDAKGQVNLGDLAGKITPNQKELVKTASFEDENAEELIF